MCYPNVDDHQIMAWHNIHIKIISKYTGKVLKRIRYMKTFTQIHESIKNLFQKLTNDTVESVVL